MASSLAEIQQFIKELGKVSAKSAAEDLATASPTDHPADGTDNMTQTAPSGPWSSENKQDVKDVVGTGNIESVGTPPDQSTVQPNQGVEQLEADEAAKPVTGDQIDGPTDHPAKASNQDYLKNASFQNLSKSASDQGAKFLAALHKLSGSAAPTKSAAQQPTQTNGTGAHPLAHVKIASLIEEAYYAADLVANQIIANAKKQAEDDTGEDGQDTPAEGPPEAGGGPEGPPPEMGGGLPPGMPPEAGGGEGDVVQELLAALAERGMTPEDFLALINQIPPGGGDMGGPPGAEMGGPPPEMGGGLPPGGPAPLPPDAGGMQVQASHNLLRKTAETAIYVSKKRSGQDWFPARNQKSAQLRARMHDHIGEMIRRRK